MQLTEAQLNHVGRLLWTFGGTMADLIAALSPEWTECAVETPTEREPYLVFTAIGTWRKGYYTGNAAVPWIDHRGRPLPTVTHWRKVGVPRIEAKE